MNKNKFLALSTAAFIAGTLFSNVAYSQDNTFTIDNQNTQQQELSIPNFETIQVGNSGKAVVFIGGAGDTYNYWDKHINELSCQNVTVLGYTGIQGKGSMPFNTDYLDDNANIIANGISDLSKDGYSDIQWVAHSLGGVVSLKSAHIIEEKSLLADNAKVNLVAVNSPIGGYSAATMAMYTPFAREITKSLNYAMSTDMSPESDFYKSLSEPLSGKITTTLIESKEDTVAMPSSTSEKERYELVSNTFNNHITVNGSHTMSSNPDELSKFGVNLSNSSYTNINQQILNIRNNQNLNLASNTLKIR